MSLEFFHLNESTRRFMLEEIDLDSTGGTLYLCSYFSASGQSDYLGLLQEAARGYDDNWLANSLRQGGRMNAMAMRRKPKGGFTEVRVPVTAPDTFAEGEFNRFYARGLCRFAIDGGIESLLVYRARASASPRPDSERKIGTSINAAALLQDLRIHPGTDTAFGLPNGPNSGLSVRLPT